MNYLWDTNILIHYIRQSENYKILNDNYHFWKPPNKVFLSIVSIGEIYSLALQLQWGEKKLKLLSAILKNTNALPIAKKDIIQSYARIDAYSQGKLMSLSLSKGVSARNMGKNDLWIAATAHKTKTTLITMDMDFNHLNNVFIKLGTFS